MEEVRDYNEKYTGEYTSRIAFPIGGLGTGMFCVEGSGAISNMNIRHWKIQCKLPPKTKRFCPLVLK